MDIIKAVLHPPTSLAEKPASVTWTEIDIIEFGGGRWANHSAAKLRTLYNYFLVF